MRKCCTKCNVLKPLTEFGKRKNSKDGLYVWCKICASKASMDHYRTEKGRETNKKAALNYKLKNSEKIKQYMEGYRKIKFTPEYKEEQRQKNKLRYQNNLEKYKKYRDNRKNENRENSLKANFGINIKEYNVILEKQNHCCDICGLHKSNFTRQLAVDHCHTTDKVRGLLCVNCNLAIGNFRDDITVLKKAINYLQKHN
jgi:hypothetical protein